eukprot:jgi/Mesvir1/20827/Mv07924-RA.1
MAAVGYIQYRLATWLVVLLLLVPNDGLQLVKASSPRRRSKSSGTNTRNEKVQQNQHASILLAAEFENYGKTAEAIEVYETVASSGSEADAHQAHMALARLYMSQRQFDKAELSAKWVATKMTTDASAQFNVALLLHLQNKNEEAIAAYRKVLKLRRHHPDAISNLGLLLRLSGQGKECLKLYQDFLSTGQTHPEIQMNTVTLLGDLGMFKEAIDAGREALRRYPERHDARMRLGLVLQAAGQEGAAEPLLRENIKLFPTFVEAYIALGGILMHRFPADAAEAESLLRQAVSMSPDNSNAHTQLATFLARNLSRSQEAVDGFLTAIKLEPNNAVALENLALSLQTLPGHEAMSESAFRRRLKLGPSFQSYDGLGRLIMNQLGDSLPAWASKEEHDTRQARLEEAESNLRLALEMRPQEAYLRSTLGMLLDKAGRTDESFSMYQSALALQAHQPMAVMSVIRMMLASCFWDGLDRALHALRVVTEDSVAQLSDRSLLHTRDKAAVQLPDALQIIQYPLPATLIKGVLEIHAERIAHKAQLQPKSEGWTGSPVPRPTKKAPGAKLTLAYMSSDLRQHPVGKLMLGAITRHNRSRFKVVCLCTGWDDGSDLRKKIMSACDKFVRLNKEETASALAQRIVEEEVDILVELNGYTNGHRLDVLSLRPAPLQIAYLGYPGTLGASFVDLLVSDRVIATPSVMDQFSETLLRLPGNYISSDYPAMEGHILAGTAPSRTSLGLPEDAVVFACFNKLQKVERTVFAVWMSILRRVPGSVLWLAQASATRGLQGGPEQLLRREAEAHGIAPHRIIFTGFMSDEMHLLAKGVADLFLDTPAYNAHTTSLDSLWAGVPVLTMPTEQMAGRIAASIVEATGCGQQLIVSSYKEYEDAAVALTLLGTNYGPGRGHRCDIDDEKEFCIKDLYSEQHQASVDSGSVQVNGRRKNGQCRNPRLASVRLCILSSREQAMLATKTQAALPKADTLGYESGRLTNASLFDTARWVKNFEAGLLLAWEFVETGRKISDVGRSIDVF